MLNFSLVITNVVTFRFVMDVWGTNFVTTLCKGCGNSLAWATVFSCLKPCNFWWIVPWVFTTSKVTQITVSQALLIQRTAMQEFVKNPQWFFRNKRENTLSKTFHGDYFAWRSGCLIRSSIFSFFAWILSNSITGLSYSVGVGFLSVIQ